MRSPPRSIVLWLSLMIISAPALAATIPVVQLSRADQARFGVHVQSAQTLSLSPQVRAVGHVLDPRAWLSSTTDLSAAMASSSASAAEARRLQRLYSDGHNTSLKALEAARARARIDAMALERQRWTQRIDWGAALADLTPARQMALSARLASGHAVLVRVDAPGAAAGLVPTAATLRPTNGGAAIDATILERAPTVDPTLQAPAWLCVVEGANAERLRPGQSLRVWLQVGKAKHQAIRVPENAIVRDDGRPYVYVRISKTRFQPHLLRSMVRHGDGWAAVTDIAPGAALVTRGVDVLWWAQQGASGPRPQSGHARGDGDDD